jgi:hypothetical protein
VGHLWTRGAGGQLPLVSAKARVPDCAILFDGARTLPVLRNVVMGQPAPSRRPLPGRLESGLLLCIGDAARLEAALTGWPVSATADRALLQRASAPVQPEPPIAPARSTPPPACPIQPPPTAKQIMSRRQAMGRLVGSICGLGLASLTGAVVAALLVAGALAREVPLLLGAFGLTVVIMLVAILWPRRRPAADVGERVAREGQPALWELCSQAAEMLGSRPPDEMRITLWPTVSLSMELPFPASPRTTLRLGLPALALLTPEQLQVIVAATLDGQREHAAALLNLAWRAQHPVQRALRMRGRTLMAVYARRLIARTFGVINERLTNAADQLVSAIMRDAEERLERTHPTPILQAAQNCLAAARHEWPQYWTEIVVPALSSNDMPSLTQGFRARLDAPLGDDCASELVIGLPFLEERLLTATPR